MNTEERRPRSSRLYFDQRRPTSARTPVANDTGQFFDCLSLEQGRKGQFEVEDLVDLAEQTHGQKRSSAEVKVILPQANCSNSQDLGPDLCQPLFGFILDRKS